jgi:hypothetical protein
MADFTKTGSQIDEWAVVAAASIRKGASFDIPSDLKDGIIVTLCKTEAVAHDGEGHIIIECSRNTTGDEGWAEIVSFQTNAETASTTTLDAEAAAAVTTVPLTATTNFETKGDRYLIKNGTIANSEIVRNNGYSSGVSITILDGLTNTQQNGVSIFTTVEQFILSDIPEIFRRVRVLINNKDADCDLMSRTEIGRVTELV